MRRIITVLVACGFLLTMVGGASAAHTQTVDYGVSSTDVDGAVVKCKGKHDTICADCNAFFPNVSDCHVQIACLKPKKALKLNSSADKASGANGTLSGNACVPDCKEAVVLWDCEDVEGVCSGNFNSSVNCFGGKGLKKITPFSGAVLN